MTRNHQSRKYDVITFGDMCVDLVVTGNDVVPEFGQVEKIVGNYVVEMGGSCCIFACQAARLGLNVAIIGTVGRDIFGELVLGRLNEWGVDTSHVKVDPNIKTGLGIALCQQDDRAILTYIGSLNAIDARDVTDDLLASASHLHHGSYFLHTQLRPHIPDIIKRARLLDLTISLDTNWDPEGKWGREWGEIMPMVDIFMPNEQETLRITGYNVLSGALTHLSTIGARLITVKQGVAGALVFDGSTVVRCNVQPATGGDSIGAGDSFDAGFLAGWLRGLSLEKCLHIGCECGRSVAGSIGGIVGQPTWEQVM